MQISLGRIIASILKCCNYLYNWIQSFSWVIIRVGILARLQVIDPLLFLWMHKFQLKLTCMRPTRCASIYSVSETFNAKLLTIFRLCCNKASYHTKTSLHPNCKMQMCLSIVKEASSINKALKWKTENCLTVLIFEYVHDPNWIWSF